MEMKVVVATHPTSLSHDTGGFHPERPQRVGAVRAGLERSGLEVVELEAPEIPRSVLTLVHDPGYVDFIEELSRLGGGAIDFDTRVSPETFQAALHSAGAVTALVEELEPGGDVTGFAVTRPPGHHALPDRAMGFCIFNNVGIAAAWLRSRGERVAVLDWDVHHGNGTQAMFADDPGVLYVSIHQEAFYPYEGDVGDIDRGAAGTTINIPLPAGTAVDVVGAAWTELVLPVVSQFAPDWILLSAGYDAHLDDPLADMAMTSVDYGWMAARLAEIHPVHRIVSVLEGGYDLAALESSAASTVSGLAGEDPGRSALDSPPHARESLAKAAAAIATHWKV
jgi:acetoin utilization deacetylase AcuC-like enzyme